MISGARYWKLPFYPVCISDLLFPITSDSLSLEILGIIESPYLFFLPNKIKILSASKSQNITPSICK
jgi:hypothetical protein